MADFKFYYDANLGEWADTRMGDDGWETHEGFETAILMSVGTDLRVEGIEDDPRGWWADNLDPKYNRNMGNKSWTLHRNRLDQPTLKQLEQYYVGSLAWMVDTGAAIDVVAHASKDGTNRARIQMAIVKPDGSFMLDEFIVPWNAQLGRA